MNEEVWSAIEEVLDLMEIADMTDTGPYKRLLNLWSNHVTSCKNCNGTNTVSQIHCATSQE